MAQLTEAEVNVRLERIDDAMQRFRDEWERRHTMSANLEYLVRQTNHVWKNATQLKEIIDGIADVELLNSVDLPNFDHPCWPG